MSWLALVALCCFAANSLLARVALRGGQIDAASFTAIRLLSGAVALWVIVLVRSPRSLWAARPQTTLSRAERWTAAVLLFLYAAPFSFAYLQLSAGTGALILFAAVQLTMIGAGLRSGERPHWREWLGLTVALGGLLYLNLPGLERPAPLGAGLMALAGTAWGFYSLRGRRASAPLRQNAESFLLGTPFAVALTLAMSGQLQVSRFGIACAVASGALASGGGYAIWYAVLPSLSATRAGTIQLSVPVVAALAGVLLLGESLSLRLVLSAGLILGGVALAVSARGRVTSR